MSFQELTRPFAVGHTFRRCKKPLENADGDNSGGYGGGNNGYGSNNNEGYGGSNHHGQASKWQGTPVQAEGNWAENHAESGNGW